MKKAMQFVLAVLFVLCFFKSAIADENNLGLAPYWLLYDNQDPQKGGWDCDGMGSAYNALSEWRLSILWRTPGKNLTCYNRVIKDSRLRLMEIHFRNEVCDRDHRCGSYEALYGITPQQYEQRLLAKDPTLILAMQQDAAEMYNALIRPLPSYVDCYVDVGLESNLSVQAGAVALSAIRGIVGPRCLLVWSPIAAGGIPGVTFEQHGANPQLQAPCIYNNDGTGLSGDSGAVTLASYPQCAGSFLWTVGDNCNIGVRPGQFIDPQRRTGCSRAGDFNAAVAIVLRAAQTAPPPPAAINPVDLQGCKAQWNPNDGAKRGFTSKYSDSKKTTTGKPALVILFPNDRKNLPSRFRSVVIKKDGVVINQMRYVYQYTEDRSNRPVWQANLSSEQMPYNAVVNADGNCWPLVNAKGRVD